MGPEKVEVTEIFPSKDTYSVNFVQRNVYGSLFMCPLGVPETFPVTKLDSEPDGATLRKEPLLYLHPRATGYGCTSHRDVGARFTGYGWSCKVRDCGRSVYFFYSESLRLAG